LTTGNGEFDAFFRKHVVSIIRHLVRQGFGQMCAEEAVEDTMVSLCTQWDDIQHPLTWVRRTAYWRAVKVARAARAGPVELTDADVPPHLDDDPVIAQESAARVQRLLAGLSDRRRAVLSWWLNGFDDREIARELGISEATVRSHKRYGLADISAKLKLEGGGE
jgi:RNA polymerase sigma-70 factor (ECF subfamily)